MGGARPPEYAKVDVLVLLTNQLGGSDQVLVTLLGIENPDRADEFGIGRNSELSTSFVARRGGGRRELRGVNGRIDGRQALPQPLGSGVDPDEFTAPDGHRVGEPYDERHRHPAKHHGRTGIEELPDDSRALLTGGDRPLRVRRAVYLNDIDAPIGDQRGEPVEVLSQRCEKMKLYAGVGRRPQPAHGHLRYVHSLYAKPRSRVPRLLGQDDHRLDASALERALEPHRLIVRTPEGRSRNDGKQPDLPCGAHLPVGGRDAPRGAEGSLAVESSEVN